MTKKRDALNLALAVLENIYHGFETSPRAQYTAITAVKEALIEPKREWVGLTAEERNAIEAVTLGLHGIPSFFATAIEAKLKELNHD